ncbi:phospholipid phosphatase 3-like isoform X2 [Syngnathoides biaculeatus]|uniref:phospholipid phosphatase 3-like isoform X2 n=1 Tax=Syngnathoides biaculeatus TaxID=300417 RepID=UPI002ADDC308|nr:phospholipid phosphatase 3-like isoform X2 [Syngnathoides biaculeatus]
MRGQPAPQRAHVSAETRTNRSKGVHTKSGSLPAHAAAGMENTTDNEPTQIGHALFTRKLLVVSDVLCLLLVSIPFFASELKAVRPYRRGFSCGDPSIAYPYLLSEIVVGECYRVRLLGISTKAFVRNKYVSCLYKELGAFLFGCCIGQSLTNMAKLSVGRLRPHFLSVCGVTYISLNCTQGTYLESVNCPNTDHRSIEEARKSFFSGHASFAMYTMLYLAFYLQARLTWRNARLLRPVLQFFLFLLAIYTGLTRVTDNRHHPSDVVFGYLIGAFTAYWVAFYISSMFKRPNLNPSPMETQDNHLLAQHSIC